MSRSDRIALASIKTLTLYDGRPTKARRTAPVPQLECTGSVCREYQPSAIQCTNAGGSDIDIDWKCEADLPSSLRFGRLSVSCEGWDRPGDPFVLRGSCGLAYSLVRTPQYAQTGAASGSNYTYLFGIVLILLAIFFYISRRFNPSTSVGGGSGSGGGGGPTSTSGFGYRSGGGPTPPPPPYTKYPSPNQSDPSNRGWSPGFWTGLGAGGLAASAYHFLTRPNQNPNRFSEPRARTEYDWERSPLFTRTAGAARPEASAARRRNFGFSNDHDDYGNARAGSSTGPGTQLGEMRRATGFGGSSVR